jgi:hypothetical protein
MSYKGIRYEGSIVGKPEVIQKRSCGKLAGLVPESRLVFTDDFRR